MNQNPQHQNTREEVYINGSLRPIKFPLGQIVIACVNSGYGKEQLTQLVQLTSTEKYTTIKIDDPIIDFVLIAEKFLKKITEEGAKNYVLNKVVPRASEGDLWVADVDVMFSHSEFKVL